jgi:hypothetical protein
MRDSRAIALAVATAIIVTPVAIVVQLIERRLAR